MEISIFIGTCCQGGREARHCGHRMIVHGAADEVIGGLQDQGTRLPCTNQRQIGPISFFLALAPARGLPVIISKILHAPSTRLRCIFPMLCFLMLSMAALPHLPHPVLDALPRRSNSRIHTLKSTYLCCHRRHTTAVSVLYPSLLFTVRAYE